VAIYSLNLAVILKPDSLLDIIENYEHLAKETDKIWDFYKGKMVSQ